MASVTGLPPKSRFEEFLDKVRADLVVRHHSARTVEAYVGRTRQYVLFHCRKNPVSSLPTRPSELWRNAPVRLPALRSSGATLPFAFRAPRSLCVKPRFAVGLPRAHHLRRA